MLNPDISQTSNSPRPVLELQPRSQSLCPLKLYIKLLYLQAVRRLKRAQAVTARGYDHPPHLRAQGRWWGGIIAHSGKHTPRLTACFNVQHARQVISTRALRRPRRQAAPGDGPSLLPHVASPRSSRLATPPLCSRRHAQRPSHRSLACCRCCGRCCFACPSAQLTGHAVGAACRQAQGSGAEAATATPATPASTETLVQQSLHPNPSSCIKVAVPTFAFHCSTRARPRSHENTLQAWQWAVRAGCNAIAVHRFRRPRHVGP
jgi:hypothetical protein